MHEAARQLLYFYNYDDHLSMYLCSASTGGADVEALFFRQHTSVRSGNIHGIKLLDAAT